MRARIGSRTLEGLRHRGNDLVVELEHPIE
jgi:hypothetical protein